MFFHRIFICVLIEWTARSSSLVLTNAKAGAAALSMMFGAFLPAQYETAQSIPSQVIKEHQELSGTILKVYDGDTYRFRHLPHFFASERFEGSMSANTITVRAAAIDTPEIAKKDKPGQLFSVEARDFAAEKLFEKSVKVKCLSRDQYGRLIGEVSYQDGLSTRDISEELLRRGLAVVYRQGGAQYDGGISRWNEIEKEAKSNKRGVWSVPNFELPSEYKKRMKQSKVE